MREFEIKDIVVINGNNKIMYMIVDFADFSVPSKHGKKSIVDIDYELMQVYPIRKNSKSTTVSQNDIRMYHSSDTKRYEQFLYFLQRDRERQGWFGEPDYITVANQNIKSIEKSRKVLKNNGIELKPLSPSKRYDIVRYDLIENIDECLEALRDLNVLHKLFGDEAYLQLKELVTSRINKLKQ